MSFKLFRATALNVVRGQKYSFSSLHHKSLMSIGQLTNEELNRLIDLSISLKNDFKQNKTISRSRRPLLGSSMSMIFQKRSTRTRVSTETGMSLLGGHALMLGPQDIQLGVNESLKDTGLIINIVLPFFKKKKYF